MNDYEYKMSDLVYEYYNNFLNQYKKLISIRDNIINNLVVNSSDETAMLINKKITIQLDQLIEYYGKIENWWLRYLNSARMLNSGFVNKSLSMNDENMYFNDAKRILNEELS